jgi:excisionase family DNA binding protein
MPPKRPLPTPPASRKYISIGAAAEYLDVTPKTIRRFISEGRLPAYRLGKRMLRVDLADVQALPWQIP